MYNVPTVRTYFLLFLSLRLAFFAFGKFAPDEDWITLATTPHVTTCTPCAPHKKESQTQQLTYPVLVD
jgi:hypothetical protein